MELIEVEGKGPKSYILVNVYENDVDSPHQAWYVAIGPYKYIPSVKN